MHCVIIARSRDCHVCGRMRRSDDALAEMIQGLRNNTYDAVILDDPVLQYVLSENTKCDLFYVGQPFLSWSLALAFPPAFDDAVVHNFSQSIVRLQVRERIPKQ